MWQLLSLIMILISCRGSCEDVYHLPSYLEAEAVQPTMLIMDSRWTVSEQFSVPDSMSWAHCSFCTLSSTGVVDFAQSNVTIPHGVGSVLLSWSQWNEFFFAHANDKFYFQHNQLPHAEMCDQQHYLVRKPFYIIPMIAMHPGHILIDVLENLYDDMIQHYGNIRSDAIIVIDVATNLQRIILTEIIDSLINTHRGELHKLESILHIFTSGRVYDKSLLGELMTFDGRIIFENLHLGIDMEYSHYYYGYRFHPWDITGSEQLGSVSLIDKYNKYASNLTTLIWELMDNSTSTFHHDGGTTNIQQATYNLDVLIVVKSKNRAIGNVQEMTAMLSSLSLTWKIVDLAELKFYDQMYLFQNIRYLVSVAGTAIHNAQFMKANTSIIVIMQPYWCDFSWMYTNQLHLLGINFHILCTRPEKTLSTVEAGARFFGFHRKTWKQGTRISKLVDININIAQMKDIFKQLEMYQSDALMKKQFIDHSVSRFAMKLNLIVSNIAVEIQPEENFQVSVFFDILGDENYIGNVLNSLPYLSLCSDFPYLSESPPTCVTIERMNYYASLQFHFNSQIPFALAHFWLQSSPAGGKLQKSDVYIPLETRFFIEGSGDDYLMELQNWLINNPIVLRYSTIEYRSGKQAQQLWLNNLLRDCCGDIEAGLPAHAIPASLTPVHQDIFSHAEQVTEYLQYFQYIDPQYIKTSKTFQLNISLDGTYDLQIKLPQYCENNGLREHNCAALVRRLFRNVYQRKRSQIEGLPAVQDLPSPYNPFVFLHIEKTGGTTLRDFIVNSSDHYGLNYFIPCYKNFTCFNFQLPQHQSGLPFHEATEKHMDLSKVSVIAGHFFWNVWKPLPQASGRNQLPNLSSSFKPSCFVMARNPIQRIISFYDQRFYREVKSPLFEKDFNNFSTEEWEQLLIYQRFARLKEDNKTVIIVDEGMSDAACRTMANIKTTAGLENPTEIAVPPELTQDETRRALENSKHCVIGVLERWEDTVRVINHWFPWIFFDNKFGLQLNRGSSSNRYIRPDLLEVTIRNNQCDMHLYDQMVHQFEKQLEILNTPYFS